MKSLIANTHGRFDQLLGRSKSYDIWDTALMEIEECIVAPTKGSIVPDWLLIVPRKPFLNYSRFATETGHAPFSIVSAAVESLCSITGSRAIDWIWFEHGPSTIESAIGCGVDYAHIHLLYAPTFNFDDFSREVALRSNSHWDEVAPIAAYGGLKSSESYYLFGNRSAAFRLKGANLGSQFFRKVVATLAGIGDQWDYHSYPHTENVVRTLDNFGSIHKAA